MAVQLRRAWLPIAMICVALAVLGRLAYGCVQRGREVAAEAPDAGAVVKVSLAPALAASPPRSPARPPGALFLDLELKIENAPLPARYAKADPADKGAPRAYLAGLLCAGDEAMRERWYAAAEKLAPPRWQGLALLGTLEDGCRAAAGCDAFAKDVEVQRGARRELAWMALARCARATDAPLFARADAPAPALFRWFSPSAATLPSERLRTAAAATTGGSERWTMFVALCFRAGDDAGAAEVALEVWRRADPKTRAALAPALQTSKAPALNAAFAEHCKANPGIELCENAPGQPPPEAKPPAPGDEPGPGEPAALESCVDDAIAHRDLEGAEVCVLRLGELDRATLRARAMRLRATGVFGEEVANALERFASSDAMVRELERRELIDPKRRWLTDRPMLTVRDALRAHGAALDGDARCASQPKCGHDELLYELAGLAGGALAGVAFEESLAREAHPPSDFVLTAYMDGKRYTAGAFNFLGWYDLDTALGFLNALLRERRSALRFAALPTGDQRVTLICAPKDALEKAASDGLLEVAQASFAMNVGKLAAPQKEPEEDDSDDDDEELEEGK